MEERMNQSLLDELEEREDNSSNKTKDKTVLLLLLDDAVSAYMYSVLGGEEVEGDDNEEDIDLGKKIGTKKRRKLQEKAEKKALREVHVYETWALMQITAYSISKRLINVFDPVWCF